MKIAAMILGIIGGIVGVCGAIFALFVGGLGGAFGANGASTITGLGMLAIPFAIMGIVGGAVANYKPSIAGIMMILSTIGGVIAISWFYSIAAILLVIGTILAFVASKKEPPKAVGTPNDSVSASASNSTNGVSASPTPWYKKPWFWVGYILTLASIVLIVVAAVSIDTTKTKPAVQQKDKKAYIVNIDGVGKFKGIYVNDVGFAIVDFHKEKTLGNNLTKKTAQGEFIVFDIAVTNNQKDKVTVDSNSFVLVDDQGRVYSHSVEGESALSFASIAKGFNLTALNPGITVHGVVVFDVPPGLTGLKLQVRGGMTGDKELIPLEVVKAPSDAVAAGGVAGPIYTSATPPPVSDASPKINKADPYHKYLNNDSNLLLCDGHMGTAWYVKLSSLVVFLRNPPNYLIGIDVLTVDADAGYVVKKTETYQFKYDYNDQKMYVRNNSTNWRYIPHNGSWAESGIVEPAGKIAFQQAYGIPFYH